MPHKRLARPLLLLAAVAVAACSSSTAPSGACAADERAAELLYGPPLSISMHGDTTIYDFAGSQLDFISQGSSCVEQYK